MICGGDNKERDTIIHELARTRALASMDEHPCGCGVCYANSMLFHLGKARREFGADPETGQTTGRGET